MCTEARDSQHCCNQVRGQHTHTEVGLRRCHAPPLHYYVTERLHSSTTCRSNERVHDSKARAKYQTWKNDLLLIRHRAQAHNTGPPACARAQRPSPPKRSQTHLTMNASHRQTGTLIPETKQRTHTHGHTQSSDLKQSVNKNPDPRTPGTNSGAVLGPA